MTSDDPTEPGLLAHRCQGGHLTYPGHAVCPECGREQTDTVDLSDETGEVLTWTESRATPSGVREPNTVAIVVFEVGDSEVRAIGGTTDPVSIGDAVEPIYMAELRNPSAAIRAAESQEWDGYRFRPIE